MNLPEPIAHPVFLDMDGVLSDFFGGVAALFHRPVGSLGHGEYDMTKVLECTPYELHARITQAPYFWRDLAPYPWAAELVALFDFSRTGGAFILSTPWPNDAASWAQKVEWCWTHFSIPADRVILTLGHKYLLAGRGRLLIDDRVDECLRWRALGGRAVEFPAHHNHVRLPDGMDAVAMVSACLATHQQLFPS
jgi:hypothetical protein